MGRLLGLVLLAAASLKGWQLLHRAAPAAAFADFPSPVAELLVCCEFALGLWLVSGLRFASARALATVCFTFFGGVSLAAVLAGEPSCGCFGDAEVSPLVSFAIDALAVVGLLASGRASPGPAPRFEADAVDNLPGETVAC
ncbi:MAG TPA: MauE/DoxX family redox-associated membrane protein [Pirellulales bacterium]|nr:MauE/DoxX family redox-associated membrane protein [Pirellulales bacterium]